MLTRSLIAFIPQQQPLLIQPRPDVRILSFSFVLTLITGVVFGLLPALRASNPDQWATLKDTVGGIAGRRAARSAARLRQRQVGGVCRRLDPILALRYE